MDPILYNRLTVELAYFTILVLFAVVALLMIARKSANVRQVVTLQNRQPSNAALANIARQAQARIGELPPAPFFQPAGASVLEDRAATSSALDEIARAAQMRINALPSASVPQYRPHRKGSSRSCHRPGWAGDSTRQQVSLGKPLDPFAHVRAGPRRRRARSELVGEQPGCGLVYLPQLCVANRERGHRRGTGGARRDLYHRGRQLLGRHRTSSEADAISRRLRASSTGKGAAPTRK